ncbi:hypothetical protein C1645_743544 [Glomus cerebriforme]|uniref:Uncharacterized protein n=1 Tax=Glomus cerebriforme TaxID=658196 RepID=A0A397SD19_9GLOM|nr:hypothetical protein C1645_743544 [Glomus cerebriforme]
MGLKSSGGFWTCPIAFFNWTVLDCPKPVLDSPKLSKISMSFGLSKTCPKLSKTVQNPYLPKLVIILARINFKSCDLSKTCPLKKGFGFGQVLGRVLDKCPKRQFVQLPNTGLNPTFLYF